LSLLGDLAAAFSYFSVLPVRHTDEPPGDGAIAFLPIVGLVIGALAGLGAYGVWLLVHNEIAAAIVAWVLSIALSGAIHVDGFLDACDGLFAMASPQRRLEIMRDPHHGTYAIVGGAIAGVLWLYALAQIPAVMMPAVLAIVSYFARWGGISVAGTVPNARTERTFRPSTQTTLVLAIVTGLLFVSAGAKHGLQLLIGVVLSIAISYALGRFMSRRLGGVVNGDCYGAVIVVTEVALLLTYPALLRLQ
jgi:adenosylcobinamide-GDP ribazoletransferase